MHNKIKYLSQRIKGCFIDKVMFIVVFILFINITSLIDYQYHDLKVLSVFANDFDMVVPNLYTRIMFGYPGIECIVFLAAYIVIAAHFFGTTYGMNKYGLSIQDSNTGKKPGIMKIFCWYFLAQVSAITFGIGHLWAFIDTKGRTLHDIIMGVRIVYKEKYVNSIIDNKQIYKASRKRIHLRKYIYKQKYRKRIL